MSKDKTITVEGFKSAHCGVIGMINLPITVGELSNQMRQFDSAHLKCRQLALARRRYRLHTKCRKAGLVVDARMREVTNFDADLLPAPAVKLLIDFQYNFQHTII
jgi:hypothetical protein